MPTCSIAGLLREIVRYIGASPLSRLYQLDTLRGLDDHLLRDIGLDREQAHCARPFADRDVDRRTGRIDRRGDPRSAAFALYDQSGVGGGA
ncbi:MAG: DUF1127 domain-containing protein [Alphaproteobacteria bacterium]|nr:DUF1127 domain-containing protein [Alphaproteobacteria bacterium]